MHSTLSELSRTEIVLIAALAEENHVIGQENSLPWHLPEDLKRFKRLTLHHPLVMGRKTFESLLEQFGGPLPNREHVVLTSHPERVTHEAARVFSSLDEVFETFADHPRLFIGGGQTVYEQTLPIADRLELTLVEGHYDGDAFFPEYEPLIGDVFELVKRDQRDGFRFDTFLRIPDQLYTNT